MSEICEWLEMQEIHINKIQQDATKAGIYYCKTALLHVLLYHMAVFVLYSLFLMFLYWKISFACLASVNFRFMVPCILPILILLLFCLDVILSFFLTKEYRYIEISEKNML